MNTPISLAVVGSWSISYIKLIDEFPKEGTAAEILQERLSNGGTAYNTAVNISRLDPHIPIFAVGTIGCDLDGESILEDLKSHQISTKAMVTSPDLPTGYEDVTSVKKTGRCTIFRQKGANQLLSKDSLKSIPETVSHYYFSSLIENPEIMIDVLTERQKKGAHLIVSVNQQEATQYQSKLLPVLGKANTVILGLAEFELIMGESVRVGGSIDSESLIHLSSEFIKKSGLLEKLFIHFPEGALYRKVTGTIAWESSIALPRSKTSSSYGSGDAFKSGVILGILHSYSKEKILRLGHAAAAAAMMDLSASGGVWSEKKCLQLEEAFGKRPPLVSYTHAA